MSQFVYTMRTCGYKKCAPCSMRDYESVEIDYVCDYLDRVAEKGGLTGIFLDLGAHVGLWSLSLSEWYINRYAQIPHILALEAEANNYQKLVTNAQQAETGIVPIHVAVWNVDTQLRIQEHENPGRHMVVDMCGPAANLVTQVRGVALDTIANTPEKRNIDGIKVDIEGAELLAMNGARGILAENKQIIVVLEYSVSHFASYGYRAEQLTAFMISHGFRTARKQDKEVTDKLTAGQIKRVIFVKGEIG